MNRIDRSFNDVDPATGRPFSRGHPDGVWIISIFYILILFGCVVGALAAIFGPAHSLPKGLAVLALPGIALVPSLVLMARGRALAFAWMAGVFVILALCGSAYIFQLARTNGLSAGVAVGIAFAVIGQGFAAIYAYALVRDGILADPPPRGR